MKISSTARLSLLAAIAWSRFASVSASLSCDPSHPDYVAHLPGYNQPLPSPWCSGYLTYEFQGRTIHTHYALVTAEDDFDNDKPLLFWSNGGPGSSSHIGLWTELGPLQLSYLSLQTDEYRQTNIPTPIYNPHNWARLGHVLIFDHPAPVGFSYCNDDPTSHSCDGIVWTDDLASENSYLALKAFYQAFTSYQEKELYLTGESYSGIYIPTLARRIVEDVHSTIPLKGLAVGDGCLGTETNICGDLSMPIGFDSGTFFTVLFLAGHGQIPFATAHMVIKACKPDESIWEFQALQDPSCQQALRTMENQAGGYDYYALYDECTYKDTLLGDALNDYPCGGVAVMEKYLGMTEVKEALHVPQGHFFEVDNAEGFDYTPTEKDIRGFFKDTHGQFRVLIYNGDADPSINSFAAQYWTSNMGFTEVESWHPWTVDGCRQMGGYVTRYEGGFDFLTIRGSGHMVPTYKAAASFTFMKAWLEDSDYPSYDKNCQAPGAAIKKRME